MSITTYTDLELRLQAEVAALKAENENLRAYAKHERSLGAEAFAMENLDLTQQVEALKKELAELDKPEQVPRAWVFVPHNELLWPDEVEHKTPCEATGYIPLYTKGTTNV